MRTKEDDIAIKKWLDSIKDFRLHHIGECYTFITGKPWATNSKKTLKPEFLVWYQETFFSEGTPIFYPEGFEMLRDWDCTFFLRRKP